MRMRGRRYTIGLLASMFVFGLVAAPVSAAAQAGGDFSLQVTPSPLTATVKPGQKTELELKVRNSGSETEQLSIEPRSFSFDNKSGKVKLGEKPPVGIADWVSFSQPVFAIQPNQWFTQKIRLAPPIDAGFSYSFALVISRNEESSRKPADGGTLKGSLAVFTLINVDRPGAIRKLEVVKFAATKGTYEALPAEFEVQIKNSGNTIAQPAGDVFIQRNYDDKQPINTLPVNANSSYILPGTTRTLTVRWENGFQVYKSVRQDDGSQKRQLTWNWSNLSELRFGRYTAKLVAVYNDGLRDIPLEDSIRFWVIPWKMLLIILLVLLLIAAGLWTWIRFGIRIFRRYKRPIAFRRRRHHD